MTLALLVLGGLASLLGWVIGAALLWASARWTVPEKLLATIIWPGGAAGLVWIAWGERIESLAATGVPSDPWELVGVLGAAAVQLVVVGFLWMRSTRRLALSAA
ncbi:hypothetical protein [Tenggerimyces flavus]|uniref:Uncharacterized protein n=1 Tax=Tenggerimyces flavus TaxID=1708749 RepID=A0ABV7YCI5_9ACTN|nr:hypothetical protein [Tenggerimyces flavus]MBM7788198.1 zinc transporter ZupT [Tenggerimyces flavus]